MIPDADYIRNAERNGMPHRNAVRCPVCGVECDTIYTDINKEPFGCESCVKERDAYEWADEKEESE